MEKKNRILCVNCHVPYTEVMNMLKVDLLIRIYFKYYSKLCICTSSFRQLNCLIFFNNKDISAIFADAIPMSPCSRGSSMGGTGQAPREGNNQNYDF